MADTTVRVRDNGPLLIEGPVTLLDAEGKSYQLPADKPVVALCRCGLAAKKPFCDGAHKGVFESQCRVPTT